MEQVQRFLVLSKQNSFLCTSSAVSWYSEAVHCFPVNRSIYSGNGIGGVLRVPGNLELGADVQSSCLEFLRDTDVLVGVGVPEWNAICVC